VGSPGTLDAAVDFFDGFLISVPGPVASVDSLLTASVAAMLVACELPSSSPTADTPRLARLSQVLLCTLTQAQWCLGFFTDG